MNSLPETALGLGGPPRFDKYEATVFRPNEEVLETLKASWYRNTSWSEQPFRQGGYETIRQAERWETEVGIKYGGTQMNPWVGSYAGVAAPKLSTILRKWPHKVTTVDVKFDIQGELAFDYAVSVANAIRIKQPIVPEATAYGDLDGIKGRTVYFGSKQSGFRLTIYEKSKQLLSVKGIKVPPNIVRIEGRFRPQSKEAGIQMATLDPEKFYATTRWGRQVFEELSRDQIAPITLPRNEANSDDASMVAMMAQYRKAIHRIQIREGGWAEFGEYLGHLEDEAKATAEERSAKIRARNEAARS